MKPLPALLILATLAGCANDPRTSGQIARDVLVGFSHGASAYRPPDHGQWLHQQRVEGQLRAQQQQLDNMRTLQRRQGLGGF